MKGLPAVQLQLLDEVTGEELEFVNPISVAERMYLNKKIIGPDGKEISTVQGAINILVEQANEALTALAVSIADYNKHVTDEVSRGKFNDGDIVPTYQKIPESDRVHANKTLLDLAIINQEYDKKTGIVTYTRYDGSTFQWDTALEHVATTLGWDGDKNVFVLEKDGGERQEIDFARLVDIYTGAHSSTILVSVQGREIVAELLPSCIARKHLKGDIVGALEDSERFIAEYEDKIKGIEENANKYILPTAKTTDYEAPEGAPEDIDNRLGGVIAGHNISVDEEGVISAINVQYGESLENSKPVNLFLKVVSTGGPSTDPLPTVVATKSYITSEGTIIIGKDNGLFDFILANSGARISNLTIDEANGRMFRGLEIMELGTFTWYHDSMFNYAVNPSGEGFSYALNGYVLSDYVSHEEFIAMINSGNYQHGPSPELPPLSESGSGEPYYPPTKDPVGP